MSLGLSLAIALRGSAAGFSLSASVVTTAGGTTVIVTGPGVTDATVTVAGASRTVTPINATSFSFVTAAHAAGAVSVVVTTADLATHTLPLLYQAPPPATPAQTFGSDLCLNYAGTIGGEPLTWTNDAGTGDLEREGPAGTIVASTTPSGFGAVSFTNNGDPGGSAWDLYFFGVTGMPVSTPTAVEFALDVYVQANVPDVVFHTVFMTFWGGNTLLYVSISDPGGGPLLRFESHTPDGSNHWVTDDIAIAAGWRSLRVSCTDSGLAVLIDGIDAGATLSGSYDGYVIPDMSALEEITLTGDTGGRPGGKLASMVLACKTSGTFTAGQKTDLNTYLASLLVAP